MTTATVNIPRGWTRVIAQKCRVCKEQHSVVVKNKDLKTFEKGKTNIQNCFPYLNADDREILLSGMAGPCYNKFFGYTDEEE